MTFRYWALTLCLVFPMIAVAKPIEKFGIIAVPEVFEEMLMDCEYLGDVESKSGWGGLASSSLGKKGVEKRLYKKAHKLGATHLLMHGTSNEYSNQTKGSAQAFKCPEDLGKSENQE